MPLIQLRGLRKYYRMGESIVHALDGVDLDIEKGEFVAITGASGSGKSTMMHLLGCLDRPTAGTFLLNGRNVSEMSDRELARVRNEEIGFVFQTFNLINRTSAVDNVGVPMFYARAANTRGPARRALERVGLTQRAEHTPSELSGGERQRVAIARAIVNDPLLVLADEPTGNLDTRTGEQIMEIFRTLNQQGVTIILVTHEQDVAIQTKRIVQMRDGKIILDKPTEELIREARGASQTHTGGAQMIAGIGGSGWQAGQSREHPGPIPIAKQKNHGLIDESGAMDAGIPSKNFSQLGSTSASTITQPPEIGPAIDAVVQDSEVVLPTRVASGSTAVLVLGILTPVLMLAGFLITSLISIKYAGLENDFGPGKPIPVDAMIGGFVFLALLLISIITGVVSFIWGRAVRRRIREVPGRWIGGKRALAGMICGGGTLVVLICLIGVTIVMAILNARSV